MSLSLNLFQSLSLFSFLVYLFRSDCHSRLSLLFSFSFSLTVTFSLLLFSTFSNFSVSLYTLNLCVYTYAFILFHIFIFGFWTLEYPWKCLSTPHSKWNKFYNCIHFNGCISVEHFSYAKQLKWWNLFWHPFHFNTLHQSQMEFIK